MFRKTGFSPYVPLIETFANKYTNIKEEKLQVRAIKAEDICRIAESKEIELEETINFNNEKYNKLIINGGNYWLASFKSSTSLYYIHTSANVYSSSNAESRYQTSGISTCRY